MIQNIYQLTLHQNQMLHLVLALWVEHQHHPLRVSAFFSWCSVRCNYQFLCIFAKIETKWCPLYHGYNDNNDKPGLPSVWPASTLTGAPLLHSPTVQPGDDGRSMMMIMTMKYQLDDDSEVFGQHGLGRRAVAVKV